MEIYCQSNIIGGTQMKEYLILPETIRTAVSQEEALELNLEG